MNGGKASPSQIDAASLFAEFLKILSHELRSPLSVMANDLQYLSTQNADRSISSWKDALNRITASLNALEKTAPNNRGEDSIPVGTFLSHLAGRADITGAPQTETQRICGNSALILAAIDELLKIHQPATPPNLILNSREVSLRLIAPEAPSNRQSSPFICANFSLNPGTTTLTLIHAELVLRLSGAVFSMERNELLISLPVYESSADTVC